MMQLAIAFSGLSALQTTPTPGLENASASITNGFASTTGLTGVLVIGVWAAIIVALLNAMRSSTWLRRIIDAGSVVALSAWYAIHGLAAVVAVGVLLAPAYLIATADPATRATAAKWLGTAIVAYALLTAVGYVVRHRFIEPAAESFDEVLPDDSEEVAD